MDGYSMRQDIIDDIMVQLEYERKRFGERARSYDQLRHDVVLWHFVSERRPARVESPVEATCWIVTVDYHYLGFDEFKRRQSNGAIPLCLHPTSLIQILQFWLPRTQEFEEAILDSLRLPLLFQEFGDSSEKVTVTILETLARFENVAQMPKEVVGSILVNRALRQGLALEPDRQKQVELIRDAIIEQNQKAHEQLRNAAVDRDRLVSELHSRNQEIMGLKEQLIAENSKPAPRVDPILPMPPNAPGRDQLRNFAAIATLALALFVAVSAIGLMLWHRRIGFSHAAFVTWTVGLVVWMLVVSRLGNQNPLIRSSTQFKRFVKWRKWLVGLIAFAIAWDLFESVRAIAWSWVSGIFK